MKAWQLWRHGIYFSVGSFDTSAFDIPPDRLRSRGQILLLCIEYSLRVRNNRVTCLPSLSPSAVCGMRGKYHRDLEQYCLCCCIGELIGFILYFYTISSVYFWVLGIFVSKFPVLYAPIDFRLVISIRILIACYLNWSEFNLHVKLLTWLLFYMIASIRNVEGLLYSV